jgi:hypothetical protein
MAITRLGGANAITGTIPTSVGGTGSTAATLPASLINNTSIGNITALPAGVGGKVLQVVSTFKSSASTISTNSDNGTNISGLSATITPSSTSSKIFITASVTYSMSGDTWGTLGTVFITRGTTRIGVGGNNQASQTTVGQNETSAQAIVTVPISFLDSPSTTSATTYNIQIMNNLGGTQTMYVNAAKNGSARGSSTITVMEIAG